MGRLIDADDFKKFLQALCKAGAPYEEVVQLLDKQPTAYDVEKVVAELENRRNKHNCVDCKHYYNGKNECKEDCADAIIDDLFDIVRKGGVE